MKAISIRQPYASQIMLGLKRVECRSWATRHRGPLLLCANASPQIAGLPAGRAIGIMDISACEKVGDEYWWTIGSVTRIPPFPVLGRLGLFDVELQ